MWKFCSDYLKLAMVGRPRVGRCCIGYCTTCEHTLISTDVTMSLIFCSKIDYDAKKEEYTLKNFAFIRPKKTVFGADAVTAPPDPIEAMKSKRSGHIQTLSIKSLCCDCCVSI